jgi:hypothetical protein
MAKTFYFQKSKNQFVWIWGGHKADRVFSVLDVERGVFRANKKSCPGAKALCTTRVGNTMWIGNKVGNPSTPGPPEPGILKGWVVKKGCYRIGENGCIPEKEQPWSTIPRSQQAFQFPEFGHTL